VGWERVGTAFPHLLFQYYIPETNILMLILENPYHAVNHWHNVGKCKFRPRSCVTEKFKLKGQKVKKMWPLFIFSVYVSYHVYLLCQITLQKCVGLMHQASVLFIKLLVFLARFSVKYIFHFNV